MPHKVEGVDYSAASINDIRGLLVVARSGAMDQGEMTWAVIFSHAIAMLSYLVELEGGEVENSQNITESDFVSKLHTRLVQDSTVPDNP